VEFEALPREQSRAYLISRRGGDRLNAEFSLG